MTVVEARTSLWEVLAGRALGQPLVTTPGADRRDLWRDIVDRLNPARARPRLRDGVEAAELVTARGAPYVMLRSPDRGESCYLRLASDEYALARLMDGQRSVGALVAEFLRISGRLTPDQVRRLVADLAANRMLDELPVDAFAGIRQLRPGSRLHRTGRGFLAFARGRRMVLGNIDPLATVLYRIGGWIAFTRLAAVVMATVALAGLGLFGWRWSQGAESVFLIGNSYTLGALGLLGLNVIALCSHELGHALAAKHAGRRVPAAGFLLYFGIPSAFVDTTDVWMAGRKARLQTTAAGPAAALTLAGAAQLVAVAYPTLGAVCFKLSFAWYLNSLFNLNPLMALDGYYLLMDWLEIPNLRARGIAFLVLTLRRRRPRLSTLDREGRLVALYAVLAALWLGIAAALMYRIYADRVASLVIGLWHAGLWARILLVIVVLGLGAPLVAVLTGVVGRRARRFGRRVREARRERDLPNRIDALRTTVLATLPDETLTALARTGVWLEPGPGTAVIYAGTSPRAVFAVASGSVEARGQDDAPGFVRHRAIGGDLVGAGPVLAGATSPLTWTAIGPRLLAMPSGSFSAIAGGAVESAGLRERAEPERATAVRAELEQVLSAAPALQTASLEDRLLLAATARPVDLGPAQVHLIEPLSGVIIADGVVVNEGVEARRGTLLLATDSPLAVTARSRSRLWTVPVLPAPQALYGRSSAAVAGADHSAPRGGNTGPRHGVHPADAYPPLQPLVGEPIADDSEVDRRLRRRGRWLIALLGVLLLVAVWLDTRPAIVWAEMPRDRVLLTISRGSATALIAGTDTPLERGDRRYVARGDVVSVNADSVAELTFRGGGQAVLCGGSRLHVTRAYTLDGSSAAPHAELVVERGLTIARTASTSAAFAPVTLRFAAPIGEIVNAGDARFAVGPRSATVLSGLVTQAGQPLSLAPVLPGCGGPGIGSGGPGIGPAGSAGPGVGPAGSAGPGLDPSSSTSTSASPDPGTTTPSGGGPIGTATSTGPAPGPPPNTAPVIDWVRSDNPALSQSRSRPGCPGGPTSTTITTRVHDAESSAGALVVTMSYRLANHPDVAGTLGMSPTTRTGPVFSAVLGPIPYAAAHASGGRITITVRVTDPGQKSAGPKGTSVTLVACYCEKSTVNTRDQGGM